MNEQNAYWLGLGVGLIVAIVTVIPVLILGPIEWYLNYKGGEKPEGVAYKRYDNMFVGGFMRMCQGLFMLIVALAFATFVLGVVFGFLGVML